MAKRNLLLIVWFALRSVGDWFHCWLSERHRCTLIIKWPTPVIHDYMSKVTLIVGLIHILIRPTHGVDFPGEEIQRGSPSKLP